MTKKISEKIISKVHIYAEKYYIPLGTYARLSADQLDKVLTNVNVSTEGKQLALFYIAKYLHYLLKLINEKGGIILFQNLDSESCLEQINIAARESLKLTPTQIYRLQTSTSSGGTLLDFSEKIQDGELTEIYEKFEKWLENDSGVKKTITYFNCYNELMFYELNLIYHPWYKKKPPQISHQCETIRQNFKIRELERLKLEKDKRKSSKNEYGE